jgi:hypothetical protein
MLIAFVTQDNSSRRRLVAAGCVEVPTWYMASTTDMLPPADLPAVEPSSATEQELFRAHRRWQAEATGAYVEYPSVEAWASQYLDRPLPVERLAAAGCRCLVERNAASDRVLWIEGPDPTAALAALLARGIERGRQLFLFTTEAGLAHAGVELGMVAKPGSITVLEALAGADGGPGHSSLPTEWRLQGGDRA